MLCVILCSWARTTAQFLKFIWEHRPDQRGPGNLQNLLFGTAVCCNGYEHYWASISHCVHKRRIGLHLLISLLQGMATWLSWTNIEYAEGTSTSSKKNCERDQVWFNSFLLLFAVAKNKFHIMTAQPTWVSGWAQLEAEPQPTHRGHVVWARNRPLWF